jgi:hypothetical protein
MRIEDIKSIDDYESLLSTIIAAWSPERRAALAAAMAERWLPTYTAFSQAQQWGDPASLRHTLDTIWMCSWPCARAGRAGAPGRAAAR